MSRGGDPEDYMGPAVFLASPASSYMTGQNLDRRRRVDGLVADRTDLVVVGGGVFGLSTAWEAAKRGRDRAARRPVRVPDARRRLDRAVAQAALHVPQPGLHARWSLEAIAAWRELER